MAAVTLAELATRGARPGRRGLLLITVTVVVSGPPPHARNRSDVEGVVDLVAS